MSTGIQLASKQGLVASIEIDLVKKSKKSSFTRRINTILDRTSFYESNPDIKRALPNKKLSKKTKVATLEHGIDINNPLLIRLLLKKRINQDSLNSALVRACHVLSKETNEDSLKKCVKIIDLLLEARANPFTKDKQGKTAMMIALENKNLVKIDLPSVRLSYRRYELFDWLEKQIESKKNIFPGIRDKTKNLEIIFKKYMFNYSDYECYPTGNNNNDKPQIFVPYSMLLRYEDIPENLLPVHEKIKHPEYIEKVTDWLKKIFPNKTLFPSPMTQEIREKNVKYFMRILGEQKIFDGIIKGSIGHELGHIYHTHKDCGTNYELSREHEIQADFFAACFSNSSEDCCFDYYQSALLNGYSKPSAEDTHPSDLDRILIFSISSQIQKGKSIRFIINKTLKRFNKISKLFPSTFGCEKNIYRLLVRGLYEHKETLDSIKESILNDTKKINNKKLDMFYSEIVEYLLVDKTMLHSDIIEYIDSSFSKKIISGKGRKELYKLVARNLIESKGSLNLKGRLKVANLLVTNNVFLNSVVDLIERDSVDMKEFAQELFYRITPTISSLSNMPPLIKAGEKKHSGEIVNTNHSNIYASNECVSNMTKIHRAVIKQLLKDSKALDLDFVTKLIEQMPEGLGKIDCQYMLLTKLLKLKSYDRFITVVKEMIGIDKNLNQIQFVLKNILETISSRHLKKYEKWDLTTMEQNDADNLIAELEKGLKQLDSHKDLSLFLPSGYVSQPREALKTFRKEKAIRLAKEKELSDIGRARKQIISKAIVENSQRTLRKTEQKLW